MTETGPAGDDAAIPKGGVLPVESQLCFAVHAAARAFTAAYRPLLDPLGLTYPQYLVLLVLWDRDGLGVKSIAERLHLESGTLTPLLKRLEAAGYVRRRRVPEDERHLRVELTAAGRALRDRAAGVREGIVRALGGAEEQLEALRLELDRIVPLLRSGRG